MVTSRARLGKRPVLQNSRARTLGILALLACAPSAHGQPRSEQSGLSDSYVIGPSNPSNPFGRPANLSRFFPAPERRKGWQFVPKMTAQEVYTDNVTLAPSGSAQSDFVTDLSPGLSIHGNTRRLLLDLNYQAQNLLYADHSAFDTTNHLFQANGTGTLIDHVFFLDFSTRYGPQNISNTGRAAIDNISVTNNRTNVFTYTVSPDWKQRLSNIAKLETRYSYNAIQSSQANRLPTSRGRDWNVSLASGPRFTRMLWSVDYQRRATTGGGSGTKVLSSLIGDTKYVIDSRWTAEAKFGLDVNELGAGIRRENAMWGVGGVWTPNARTYLEATIGRRFGRNDYLFKLRHRTGKTKWIANYEQRATTTRGYLLEQTVFPVVDAFGTPVINVNTGQPLLLNVNVPVQTAEVVLSKRFQTTFSYDAHRNHWAAGAFDDVRDYQITGGSETFWGGNISWSRDLTHRVRSRLALNWSQEHLRTGQINRYAMLDLTITRRLSRTVEASIGARHLQMDSSLSGNSYAENRVMAMVNKTF